MDTLEVHEVNSRRNLREFILFPFSLYKDCPYWIPPLIREELTLFDRSKNPAFEFCECRQWIVRKNGKAVGRIAGIIHGLEAESSKTARFGWIDFIDDPEVSKLLLHQVETWFKAKDIEQIHGPFGFNDMDPEGMLVEGFDSPATITTIFNFDYYPSHLEQLGYKKSADWIEWNIGPVVDTPDRLRKGAQLVEKRFKVRSKRFHGKKELIEWAAEMFKVLNQSFQHLHGFQTLSPRQIEFYLHKYLSFIDPQFISIIINDRDEVVGFGIAMPSLSQAFKKARGRLFPFGILHILRGIRHREEIEMCLIGVRPDYQRKGIIALIFRDMNTAFFRSGFKTVRSNAVLEDNKEVHKLFRVYGDLLKVHKRRRCYTKTLV